MWSWAVLPLGLAVFGTAGIWIVYAISVSNGTVSTSERFRYINGTVSTSERFPYISECGSYPPQSTYFSQYCNICAFLGVWIMLLRFQQVWDYGDHGKANTLGLVLGFLSCAGVSVLGNFQQSIQWVVHLVGASMAFFLGVSYLWVQLFLTYRGQPSVDRHWLGPCRALCCCLCTILAITMVVLGNTGHLSAAALCEWALVMLFFCFFGLFGAEFRHMDCHQLKVQKHVLQSQVEEVVISNPHLTPVHVR